MKNKKISVVFSFAFLVLWIFLGLFSSIISSNQPLYFKTSSQAYFPTFNTESFTDYKDSTEVNAIWPLVPFSSSEIDFQNTGSQAPGSKEIRKSGVFKHYLGTDHLGRDVASGLISGARVALKIVIYSLFLSSGFGIFIGLATGFYGDKAFKMERSTQILILLVVLTFLFHTLDSSNIYSVSLLLWLIICLVVYFFIKAIPFEFLKKKSSVALDLIVSRLIEIFDSIPKILLLIAIFAGFTPSLERVIILISIISWPGITKIVRAETLIEKNKSYIAAGKALGFRERRLIFIHILPNIITPVVVFLTFQAGSIIIIESSLSFLGLGMPPDVLTWGRMLALAKNDLSAWWLVLFPGFFIFATVFSLNTLGRHISSKFQYRKRQQLMI